MPSGLHQADVDFWSLWENSRKLLFCKCLKLMNGDVCAAEDALSTAMLKAQEKMIPCRGRIYNFQGWALRLTENVCLDQLRRNKRFISYDEIPESLVRKDNYNASVQMESNERYRSQEAILNEIFEYVWNLPRRLRDPALLRFLFSEPYRNIAGRLHITEVNARKKIQEARTALKLRYGEKINVLYSSSEAIKSAPDSSAINKIKQDATSILDSVESELELCCKTAWVVTPPHDNGSQREVLVVLPFKPGWNGKGFASLLRYISLHPGGWKRRLELAQMLYAIGIWDQAEKEFRRILKKRPHSFFTRMLLGNMLMESGKGDEAASFFQETGSLAYRDSSRHYLSGMAAMCRSRTMDAIASFEKASELEPLNATFNHAKGICLFKSGEYGAALRYFQNLLTMRPEDIVSLAHCCEVSIMLNRPLQASEYADRILMKNPHDLFALRRKSGLSEPGCISQTENRKSYQRISERLQLFARMMGEPDSRETREGGVYGCD